MEWLIGFIKRVATNLVAFVAICIFIAVSPLISIGLVVWAELSPWVGGQFLGWFIVCPVIAAIWYMFIATMTRYARAKYFGVSPRNGFLWAGVRLFGGWLLSQAMVIALVLAQIAVLGPADGSVAMASERVRTMAPLLLLAAWSPVLINVIRHFMRRYSAKRINGTSAPYPVAV